MGLQTQIKMRAGFLALAAQHPRFRIIDGARTPDAVAADILRSVQAVLG
jgi:dTMP kinase